jgi:hypothetical protein
MYLKAYTHCKPSKIKAETIAIDAIKNKRL